MSCGDMAKSLEERVADVIARGAQELTDAAKQNPYANHGIVMTRDFPMLVKDFPTLIDPIRKTRDYRSVARKTLIVEPILVCDDKDHPGYGGSLKTCSHPDCQVRVIMEE